MSHVRKTHFCILLESFLMSPGFLTALKLPRRFIALNLISLSNVCFAGCFVTPSNYLYIILYICILCESGCDLFIYYFVSSIFVRFDYYGLADFKWRFYEMLQQCDFVQSCWRSCITNREYITDCSINMYCTTVVGSYIVIYFNDEYLILWLW